MEKTPRGASFKNCWKPPQVSEIFGTDSVLSEKRPTVRARKRWWVACLEYSTKSAPRIYMMGGRSIDNCQLFLRIGGALLLENSAIYCVGAELVPGLEFVCLFLEKDNVPLKKDHLTSICTFDWCNWSNTVCFRKGRSIPTRDPKIGTLVTTCLFYGVEFYVRTFEITTLFVDTEDILLRS